MADNPFGGVPRGVVQVVAGATAAYQTFSTAREAYEWFQEGTKLVKRARLTQPGATPRMDDPYGPSSSSVAVRQKRGLTGRERKAVKACCESVLEEKFIQTAVSHAVGSSGTGGSLSLLNDCSQGTGVGNRTGSQITQKWLIIKGRVIQTAAGAATDLYRFMVVVDHECFGNAMTSAQVLDTQSAISLPNFQSKKRFRILADRTFVTMAPAATVVQDEKAFEMKIPLNFTTYYNGNAGTIADIVKNSIYVVEMCDGATLTSSWNAQVIYLDG